MPYTAASWLRVLLVQGGIGLSWLLGAPFRSSSAAYQPAIQLGDALGIGWYPIRGYGLLLIVIAVGLAQALYRRHDNARIWSIALAAYWSFWAVLWTLGITYDGSLIAPFLALGFAWYAADHARKPPRQ